ncbi:MAG TPA: lysylphosphatidylglycerol synthase transmembrane domain-containing protein [Patescibacteria group bacterium]|nr:lysylphosphatidylglycerol synthase transmembrane domain-containing protein [Patescibacteria group bacterium]
MKNKKILSFMVLAGLITWLAYYVFKHRADFTPLLSISWPYLAILIIMYLMVFVSIGFFLYFTMLEFKIKLSFLEHFGLAIISSMTNYLTFLYGGMAIRALYLKKHYQFSYSEFVGTLAANYIIVFFVNSLVTGLILLKFYLSDRIFNLPISLLFGGIFVFCTAIIILSPNFKPSKNRWLQKFILAINCWHKIRKNYKLVLLLSGFSLLNMFLSSMIYYLGFRVFHIDITYFKAIFISTVAALSVLINLTPGALGIKEALVIISARIINVTSAEAIIVAVAERAIAMIILFTLGPIFSHLLLNSNYKPKKT